MSGPISQAETDRIATRIQRLAKKMLDMAEEMDRLRAIDASLDLGQFLDTPTNDAVTRDDIITFVTGPMKGYQDFFKNLTVDFDGTSGGNERRAKIDPFLVLESI